MTTEKGKTIKKWTSSQEYRDNYERIFGKKTSEPELPKNVSVQCECGTVFTTAEVGWRKCPACGMRWTHLEEAKP